MFPFPFFNHGKPLDIYSFQGEKEVVMWFKQDVDQETRKKIESLCPKVLKQVFRWGSRQMHNYSQSDEDDIFGQYVSDSGNDDPENMLQLFANDIENWISRVNELVPVSFAIGVDRITGSKWDKWSRESIQSIVSEIETFVSQHKDLKASEKAVVVKTLERLRSIPKLKFEESALLKGME